MQIQSKALWGTYIGVDALDKALVLMATDCDCWFHVGREFAGILRREGGVCRWL